MFPPSYVLYCPEISGRPGAAAGAFAAAGLRPRWWRGVHGRSWGLRTEKRYMSDGGDGFHIAQNQAAAIVGHYFLWQHLQHAGHDEALVFEDDADPGPDFAAQFGAVRAALPPDWQFVFLGLAERPADVEPKIRARFDGGLVRLVNPYGTHAYLVRWTALPVLLDRMAELRAHIDIQLYQNVLEGGHLSWYAAHPAIVRQRTQGPGADLPTSMV